MEATDKKSTKPVAASELQLTNVPQPSDRDVLSGRGKAPRRHIGNRSFLNVVGKYRDLYATTTSRAGKFAIAKSIVEKIREEGGRFLDYDAKKKTWNDVGETRAIRKTAQALREGQPQIKRRISKILKGSERKRAAPGSQINSSPKFQFQIESGCGKISLPPFNERKNTFNDEESDGIPPLDDFDDNSVNTLSCWESVSSKDESNESAANEFENTRVQASGKSLPPLASIQFPIQQPFEIPETGRRTRSLPSLDLMIGANQIREEGEALVAHTVMNSRIPCHLDILGGQEKWNSLSFNQSNASLQHRWAMRASRSGCGDRTNLEFGRIRGGSCILPSTLDLKELQARAREDLAASIQIKKFRSS